MQKLIFNTQLALGNGRIRKKSQYSPVRGNAVVDKTNFARCFKCSGVDEERPILNRNFQRNPYSLPLGQISAGHLIKADFRFASCTPSFEHASFRHCGRRDKGEMCNFQNVPSYGEERLTRASDEDIATSRPDTLSRAFCGHRA